MTLHTFYDLTLLQLKELSYFLLMAIICGGLYSFLLYVSQRVCKTISEEHDGGNGSIQLAIVGGGVFLIGAICGNFAGASRESIIGDLLPPLLAIVGSVLSLFASKDAGNRVSALMVALLFCIGLFVGASTGAFQRQVLRNSAYAIKKRRIGFMFVRLKNCV